jgi:hypothetical protein
MKPEGSKSDVAIKVLATLGIIAIIVFVGWGTLTLARKFAPNAMDSLASAFVSLTSVFVPGDKVNVSLDPKTVASGKSVTVSFEHSGKNDEDEGTYALSYSCKDGVSLTTQNGEIIFCNTAWNFAGSQSSVTVTAVSSEDATVNVPITVTFTPDDSDKKEIKGEAALKITNGGKSAATSTPETSATTTSTTPVTPRPNPATPKPRTPGTSTNGVYIIPGSAGTVSNPNGRVDLVARIIEVGVIGSDNVFVATSTHRLGTKIAVRFEIENIGDKTSPEWNFNAALPTYPFHIFHSDMQPVLTPGDKIQYTLGFDSAQAGYNKEFTVNADPANGVNESNETNNIVKATFSIQ